MTPSTGFLLPPGESVATDSDGRFAFDITVRVPLVALVVADPGRRSPPHDG